MVMVKRGHELDFRSYWWIRITLVFIPTFQPSHFHRIYVAYGGIFIIMAIGWGWLFERTVPDGFDILGIILAIIGVIVIFYMPRKRNGEKSIWSRQ